MSRYKQSSTMSLKQWAKQLFAQPSDVLYQKPTIYISGEELELQNFRGVVDYSSEVLVVDIGRGRLRIIGDGLVILALEKARLVMRGQVLNISFLEE